MRIIGILTFTSKINYEQNKVHAQLSQPEKSSMTLLGPNLTVVSSQEFENIIYMSMYVEPGQLRKELLCFPISLIVGRLFSSMVKTYIIEIVYNEYRMLFKEMYLFLKEGMFY